MKHVFILITLFCSYFSDSANTHDFKYLYSQENSHDARLNSQEWAQQLTEWNKFVCDGSEKCRGFKFSINYPKRWVVKDGSRPHIIKVFEFEERRGMIQMALYLRELDTIPTPEEILYNYNEEAFKNTFNAVEIIEFNNSNQIDFERCITATLFTKLRIYDEEILALVKPNMIFYQNYLLQVNFFIYGYEQDKEKMKSILESYNPVFKEIMYSLALVSKWEKKSLY